MEYLRFAMFGGVGRSPLGRWFIAIVTYAVLHGIHIYILYLYIYITHIYIYMYNVIYEIIYIWVINNIRFSSDALTQQMACKLRCEVGLPFAFQVLRLVWRSMNCVNSTGNGWWIVMPQKMASWITLIVISYLHNGLFGTLVIPLIVILTIPDR